ncbi:YdeI/OmpD-associated family protein [Chitinophaga barathri]|uniref:DUF1905 domain-containing protein n=1 Tax=Chitinophaga barathri TaxID=1647451 RepID=A0A3N4MPX2_9BACT|nr:YdeI/OmpD-associated family protein [Chitinophaga barathri]RPD41709.1 DUF1905 domain-containing protein [Chitinophaga barathri]
MEPLTNKVYLLERFPGKGGWTYARIPEIPHGKVLFGLFRVKGTIDGYEISKAHLMPLGGGELFLPVKAEIRKKIWKKAGEKVHIILYHDNDPLLIPAEMKECLEYDPEAQTFFSSLSETEQGYYVTWVYGAKREETRVSRLAKAMLRLARKEKFYQPWK